MAANEHRDLWWPSPTVDLGKVISFDLSRPFRCEHGGELPGIQMSYESWGALNEARDNAVLIVHPLASDCHATGAFEEEPLGWWEALIGPGRAIDTDTHFVVCPNHIGGCYGTTGPRFPAPDGEPYYDRFPLLTPRDMMRAQALFLDALGIAKVVRVIGPSMGGMVVWEWAIENSDRVGEAVVVAAPLRTTPHQIGLNWLQRRGIELDISENEVIARWGQMVARGVGMLSYRAPVGLDEKFGREWFKKPGSTLRERGMFNVESWLRHHGKRITQRFDPYTYLLFSRAMDLHDVTEGRGDLVSTLERVSCPMTVMGISSDYLYPPDEVHAGAEMLHHLGRDVRYEEIRSPHGHDAFMLETDQIAQILSSRTPASVPERLVVRESRPVNIGILGAGRVSAAFLKLLGQRRKSIRAAHGLDADVVAVAEIDPDRELDPVFKGVAVTHDPARLVERDDLHVVVDLTRGSGSLSMVREALERGRHVVTPNKVLLRDHATELEEVARGAGVRLAYHDSIAAGWPIVYLLERPMSRGRVASLWAMVSSSANRALEAMEAGKSYDEALAQAMKEGPTEPDPTLDFSGWDTVQKLCILTARTMGVRLDAAAVPARGLDAVSDRLVAGAPGIGYRVKLVAGVMRAEAGFLTSVRPMAVPEDSHLGLLRGDNHAVALEFSDGGEMVYSGSGAGELPVATSVLNDIVGLFDLRHSWTGRFPRAKDPPGDMVFPRWLGLEGNAPRIFAETGPDRIPLLRK